MSDVRNSVKRLRDHEEPIRKLSDLRTTAQALMNHRHSIAAFVVCFPILLWMPACRQIRPGGTHSNVVVLFDGRTFSGWEGETNSTFRIEQGAIIGGSLTKVIPRNEFLCTTRFYTNFVLRVKCRLEGTKDVNGGVQFRSLRIPNNSEVAGYQADMAVGWWGFLYDESRRQNFLAKPNPDDVSKVLKADGWNRYVIRCEGKHIEIWLNGLKTVDFTELDNSAQNFGVIGLQIHRGPPGEASYKDITIQEL
jgi:hypothetical protein